MSESNANLLEQACRTIQELLTSDIVSLGEVRQIAQNLAVGTTGSSDFVKDVIMCLIESGVAIGYAVNPTGNYVEFVAWRGTSEARTSRLMMEMAHGKPDFDFSVWLALAPNVDRYEE